MPTDFHTYPNATAPVLVRTAKIDDLQAIAALEKTVEDPRVAAPLHLLRSRMRVYPEGFLVAILNGKLVGYLESILWNTPSFERFDEIRDFERMHQNHGSVLYVAFLAVDKEYRRRGIASQLLQAAQDIATSNNVKKIQLVALPELHLFYENRGFHRIRTLSRFLEHSAGELMEKDLNAEVSM